MQLSDYLRCVDILNHKITPLIRLLIIQKCPMRKQTLSQEFRQNNIKSLKKLVNYHSPIVFIFIYIYLFSERAGHHDCPHFVILCFTRQETEISWFCVFLQTYGTHEPYCYPINNVLFNRVKVATLFYAFISQSRE